MGELKSVHPTLATRKPSRRWGTQHVGAVFNRIDGFGRELVESHPEASGVDCGVWLLDGQRRIGLRWMWRDCWSMR